MFKGTNKIWKGLALLLVLCMLPTVALAADEAATVEIKSAEANVAENTVTVTAEIGKKDTDITILAFRSATPAEAVLTDVEALKKAVVYIDQETAVEAGTAADSGKHTFTFIPRSVSGVGKYVNIFVGGENVTTPDYETLEMAIAAPAVTAPAKLYKGQDLVLTLAAPSASEYDFAAWKADVAKVTDAVKVNGTTAVAYTIDETAKTLTITNADVKDLAVTSVTITGQEYANVTATVADSTWYDKEAGSLTIAETAIIAGTTIEAAIVDSAQGGWKAALGTTATIEIAEAVAEPAFAAFTGLSIAGDTAQINLPVEAAGEKSYIIKITVDDYAVYTTSAIKVTSPATDAKDKLSISVAYDKDNLITDDPAYDAEDAAGMDEDELAAAFGAASVTLPAEGANGTTITWKKGEDTVSGKVDLTRPASTVEEATEVVFTATISKTVGDVACTETKEFTLKVNPVGAAVKVAAENVALGTMYGGGAAFGIENAKVATITLEKGTVDPANEIIKVGETVFLYAPERSTTNDVFVAILRANNTDSDAVADAATIEAGVSEKIYYGKVSFTTSDAGLIGSDPAAAKRLNKNNVTDSVSNKAWTDAQILACDIDGTCEITGSDAACIIRANKAGNKNEFSILK